MKLKRHLNILFVSFHLPPGAVRICALRPPGDRRRGILQPPGPQMGIIPSCTLKDCYARTWQPQGTLRPHRRQPTRFPRRWDSPGENTGVGCHFLLQRMKVKSESEVAQSCPTLSDPMDCGPPDSSGHGIFQARVLEWGAIDFSEGTSGRLN